MKIKFIRNAKSMGYSLKEIREVLGMLGQKMDAETLKERVRNKILEIDERIAAMRSIQSMLAGLLETSQEDIHNYLQSFRIHDKE